MGSSVQTLRITGKDFIINHFDQKKLRKKVIYTLVKKETILFPTKH